MSRAASSARTARGSRCSTVKRLSLLCLPWSCPAGLLPCSMRRRRAKQHAQGALLGVHSATGRGCHPAKRDRSRSVGRVVAHAAMLVA